MQWNIGIAKADIRRIITTKTFDAEPVWLTIDDQDTSIADPFILEDGRGNLLLAYEDFSMTDPCRYGILRLKTLNANLEPLDDKVLLDVKKHLSYPAFFSDNNTLYIIPESRHCNEVAGYEFDPTQKNILNKKIIFGNIPLLDPTLLKYNNKYWLFATYGDRKHEHSKLYIYFADTLNGPYTPHPKNPVRQGLKGTRPAGNFICIDNHIYRPAQNCEGYYGKSLVINKINKLSETEFEETQHMEITAPPRAKYNAGIHTLSISGNFIAIDGIWLKFAPLTKLKTKLKKITKRLKA